MRALLAFYLLTLARSGFAQYQVAASVVSAGGGLLQNGAFAAQTSAGNWGTISAAGAYGLISGFAWQQTAVSAASLPPAAAFAFPADGATLSGAVTLVANITSGSAASRVEFYIDGVREGTATSGPFSCALDISSLPPGNHTLTAVPYDMAGAIGQAATVSITVAAPAVSPTAGAPLGEVFAFPNPADHGQTTIHAQSAGADSVKIRIYDLKGALVQAASLEGAPRAGANGQQAYEYVWSVGSVASGAYPYVVEVTAGGHTFSASGKIAVRH